MFDRPSPLPLARVRIGIPAPVRAMWVRGVGPATATAAANVPITISPTPTKVSRCIASIALTPQPRKEGEAWNGPGTHKGTFPGATPGQDFDRSRGNSREGEA